MKNAIKWIIIILAGLFLLTALVLLVVPFFVDANRFKTEIETMVSEKIGRTFSINGEIDLSLFPWAGFSVTQSSLGNPEGFAEKEFASIEALDIKVKLLPLLSKDIQLKRFIVKKPKITLVTRKNGTVNYDFSKKTAKETVREKKKDELPAKQSPTIKSFSVGEFLISDGSVLIIDHAKGSKKEVSGITARLDNVSRDKPISLLLSAKIDRIPLLLEGDLGPVGENIGEGKIPVHLTLTALEQLEMSLRGQLTDLAGNPRFDLTVNSNRFSPKKLVKTLNQQTEILTADSDVLNTLSFETALNGTPEAVDLTKGRIQIDDSNIDFECHVKAFEKPDIRFTAELDKIDVDRYLPPKPTGPPAEASSQKASAPVEDAVKTGKTDYEALRSLVLNGTVKAGDIKVNNLEMKNLSVKIRGNQGVFRIDPLTAQLYEGSVNLASSLNVKSHVPETSLKLKADNIQANPLINALLFKDVMEGGVKADMDIRMSGDDPDTMKRTLNGNVNIHFTDGAIKGVDLTAMAQNIKSAFGQTQSQTTTEQPRTDFSELSCPLVIQNGVVHTTDTRMVSPMLRVQVSGKADLVHELLDLRVEPKFVATISGQGDTAQRSGIMVPVLITGRFSSPKFAPDVGGIIKQTLEGGLPSLDDFKNIFEGGNRQTEEEESSQSGKRRRKSQ